MNRVDKWQRLIVWLVIAGLIVQVASPALAGTPAFAAEPLHLTERAAASPLASSSSTATQPATLTQPLSLSRVQSSYIELGGSVVMTYTLKNTLAPQNLPDLPPGASITDTVTALADFDLADDPHTLRNVILIAQPTASSAILATSQPANSANGDYVFTLENLPPQASATVVMTASTPAQVSQSTTLIEATAWASLDGRAVFAAAAPALVLPPALGDWLIDTLDADIDDAEMLQTLGQIGGDPADIFIFVCSLGYEAYRGSLRGTRGTLWAGAGNSLDQSSLLIAMLRASGVPARYRHGSLNQSDAQTLIASMFPAPTSVIGAVSNEVPISDPVNDADLISEVQDHWWVEAYIGGAWTNLDPSFANAAIGQQFASPAGDGSDRIAELTDALRPKITIKLKVERWNQLSFTTQSQAQIYLDHTFRAVEIAASPVIFSNLVDEQNQGGLVFANKIFTYSPYLFFNDQFVYGEPYQELLTNFPLATTVIIGAWLVFEMEDLDGQVTTYERTLRDRLGYDIRTFGGSPTFALDANSSGVFDEFDVYSLSFFPGAVPLSAVEARRASLTDVVSELAADSERMQELAALTALTPEQQVEVNQIRARYQYNLGLFLDSVSLTFAELADRASKINQEGFFVKAYHDDPRLVIISHEVISDTIQFNVDLRTTSERAIAFPSQGEPATFGFNLFKGINESWLEGEVLTGLGDASALTSARVMQAASEQGIDFVFIGADNLDLLATIPLGDEAVARITAAALAGKIINIPVAAPLIDGAPALGWWEIDPNTGETIGVMENGLHNALIEFFGNLIFSTTTGRLSDFMIGATAATWDFVLKHFSKAVGAPIVGTPVKDAMGKMNQGLGCLLKDWLTCGGISKGYLDYGYMAMEAYLKTRVSGDPPLPDLLLGNPVAVTTPTTATAVLNQPATLSAESIVADLQTDFTQVDAAGSRSFYAAGLDPLASGASGGATAINHDVNANLTLNGADVQIAAPVGVATLGGQPLALGDGLALADFTGSLAITATMPTTDRVTFQGSGHLFTLALSPSSSVIAPTSAASFHVDLATTFADQFTVTLAGPEGWQVQIDNAGNAIVTPQPGAAPGDYVVVVSIQSTSHPTLILTAEHVVTILPYNGFTIDLRPDPLITTPMGNEQDNQGFINTGKAQVPNAAYVIEVTNQGNTARAYTISVSGLPGGWTLLAGARSTNATLQLPPGANGQIGLYVAPGHLPAAGESYTIQANVSDDLGQNASDSELFVMPAVPFSFVQVEPPSQLITSTGSATYDVTVTNVGNAPGVFGVTASADNFDSAVSFGALPAATLIPAGGSTTAPISVFTNGAPERRTVKLFFSSPVANTEYTPTAVADLEVVSAESAAVVAAADRCDLPAAYHSSLLSLAVAIDELAYWCEEGDCPLPLRDRVVTAGQSVSDYAAAAASPFELPTLLPLSAALTNLGSQTSDDDILAGVVQLGAAVYDLSGDSCQVEQRRFNARFTPYVQAILQGDSANFSLDVTNQGSLTTTYAITVSGIPGGDLTASQTIAPDATVNIPVNVNTPPLGVYNLGATVEPVGAGVTLPMSRTASARLNVVDKFVQVLEVIADPAFVETGVSSTTLSVHVANPSGVAQPGVAATTIFAPNGAIQFTADVPLTVLAGNPRAYLLGNVDTSSWSEGVYTITVALLDGNGALIPDGYGYGYLSVGQALQISQAVTPELVAPGMVTVATIITSALAVTTTFGPNAFSADQATTARSAITAPSQPQNLTTPTSPNNAQIADATSTDAPSLLGSAGAAPLLASNDTGNDDAEATSPAVSQAAYLPAVMNSAEFSVQLEEQDVTLAASTLANSPAFSRIEQNDSAFKYSAAWTNVNATRVSGGSYYHNSAANVTATLAFTGVWVSVGFLGSTTSGLADILIDGVSQGVVDLYRREDLPISFRYDGMSSGGHTLTVRVMGSRSAFSTGNRVQLDYVDYGDGSALADGAFEQDDSRVILSTGWTAVTYAGASGGSYNRGSAVTAWFPFSGDSFGFQAARYNGGGWTRLSVDGRDLDMINLYDPANFFAAITQTFSYSGFGPGPHVLQVSSYRDNATLDKFTTPGQAPFNDPDPPISGIARYEEDHPAIRYNGVPYTQTAQSWIRAETSRVSDGQYIYSLTANDTISFDFEGSWVGVGFATDRFSGQAQIAIDGAVVKTVDLYTRDDDTASYYFDNLITGTHTITITVLGTRHPNSSNNRVYLDFFDVWDGQPLADGTFEENNSRVLYGDPWGRTTNAGASGGSYAASGNGTAWFPFTGDSVTYQAWTRNSYHSVEVRIDGVSKGKLSTYSATEATRAFSFDGLGAGPHVMEIRQYRDDASLDAFITPAVGPGYQPPTLPAIARYEEDHPAIRYNGVPFTRTAQTWVRAGTSRVSDGQYIYSLTANDTISFDFEGSWVGVGFATDRFSGQAQIAIDGAVVKTVDLYTRDDDTASYYFDNLITGTHTITITVLGTRHPNSSNNRVYLDFFDVWDGQPLADGTFEENNSRVLYGDPWGRTTNAGASGGSYAASGNGTAWFPFTGGSVTYQPWTNPGYNLVDVRIDGVSQGQLSLYRLEQMTRTFSFNGLGAGPHVMEVRQYRYDASVDAFITPAVGSAYEPPAAPAIVRHEEDHPAMRYNGHPYRQMPQSWSLLGGGGPWTSSGAANMTTSTAGNVWSLAFNGRWVHVGFHSTTTSGQAEIFIDGASQGIVSTANGVNGIKSFAYADLITGTHTISVVVVSGTVYPDYIDVWSGGATNLGWYDLDTNDESGRTHFSYKWWLGRAENQYAYDGDYIDTFVSSNSNAWFSFVGDGLSVLGFNRDGTSLHVVIDGVVYGPFNMTAEYADQPIALHFPNLGDGPHVVQVHIPSRARLDAFNVNPANFTSYTPVIEWRDISPSVPVTTAYGDGMASSVALGDLNGDGVVELVAPSLNGRLYVYRGDGADTGDGDPIQWYSDLVGPAAEPALADLDNDGKAEIIVSGRNGTFAFRHDGSLMWSNPTVVSYYVNEKLGWGGPTVGNLDLDPEPEIVIAASEDALYVLDHQGAIVWNKPTGKWATVPVLADITGDGVLDIIVAQFWTLNVYDFFNGGQLAWSYVQTDTLNFLGGAGVFGAPAVADLNGDGGPEIIINWGHLVDAFRPDGSLLWRYDTNRTDLYRPSHITIADVTGDGQPEVITASAVSAGFVLFDHLMMVFDASGNLLWQQIVKDNTASASGVAAQDLDGDGVWEVLWNGATDGFLVIRGSDGKRLFNEPATRSGTVLDYPTLGDVDGDGYAEVVAAGWDGVFVIGHDGVWGDSRPMWNQHNYHVTNMNDDWSTPVNEPNSWQLHNTYRTQTPERTPAPAYQIAFTYTQGAPNVTVLTQTASITLTSSPPTYTWDYRQEWYQPLITTSFDSLLTGLGPGEARQVSAGVQVAYRLPSGVNHLMLPPLYVTAQGLGELAPASAQVVIGGAAVFTLTLTNPGSITDTYIITVAGAPSEWLTFPASVQLAPGQTVSVAIAVAVPANAEADVLPLLVDVENSSGGMQSFQSSLAVIEGVSATISPPSQTTLPGAAATYTLAVTNHENVARTYVVTPTGLMEIDAPPSISVAAGATATHAITVTSTSPGPQPFSVAVSAPSGAFAQADAVIEVTATVRAAVRLSPDPVAAGPGSTAIFTLTVSNLGERVETFNLQVELLTGWSAEIRDNMGPVNSVTLPPFVFDAINLQLLVTPPTGDGVGDYPVLARAIAHSSGVLAGSDVAMVQLIDRGVQVEIISGPAMLDPRDEGVWDVQVTNTGASPDTFNLEASGTVGQAGAFSTDSVSLNPGASQIVQLRVSDLDGFAPLSYLVGAAAVSQADARIHDEAAISVILTGYEAVEVVWEPQTQTVDDSMSAQAILNVTNLGNVNTVFNLSTSIVGAASSGPLSQVTLPPGGVLQMPVTVVAQTAGSYTLNGAAQSGGAGDSDTATVIFTNETPTVNAGADQSVRVDDMVQFGGVASDPDGDTPLTIAWTFGDGQGAMGNLTPTHSYDAAGVFTATLIVTDSRGAVGADSLRVTVVANQPPVVNAGADQSVRVDDAVQFSGVASDPDGDTPLSIAWDFGDGEGAMGSLTPTHSYDAAGVFTATLIVTDSRGAVGTDSLRVTVVANQPPVVNAGADQSVRVDDMVQFNGSASDPDGDTPLTIAWTFGDGEDATGSLTPTHSYDAAGVFTATLIVTDSRGAVGTDSLRVTVVANQPPVVNAGADQNVRVDDVVHFSGVASDPDGDTPLSIAWDFGDGEGAMGSLTPTHSYDAAGVFTATLIVTDSRGAVGADSLRVTAAVNQGPFVNIGPDLTAQENIAVQFSAIVSDPEDDPLTSIEWSLGDKTTITGTLSPVHAYSIAGDYTVILVVTDSRGGLGTDSLVVQVGGNQPPPPEGRIYLPLIAR